MGHCVQLLIGRGQALDALLQQWPEARAVELREGWMAVAMHDALHHAIDVRHSGGARPAGLDLAPFGLDQVMAEATAGGGGLAYVETDYFGGAGAQSAMAYRDGREVVAPQLARGGAGPINQALRAIGVARSVEADEFDTVGLGERRSMDDFGADGPVRLRGSVRVDDAPATDPSGASTGVEACPLPTGSMLEAYRDRPGAYTDCFAVAVDRPVSLAAFIEAFYTTWLFKGERLILLLIGRSCSDETVRKLAAGNVTAFAAWTVEGRTDDQFLACDFQGLTRSWLMVTKRPGGTRLYFGSAIVPTEKGAQGAPRPGFAFRVLTPLHTVYSRALLRAAAAKLNRSL